MSVILTLTDTHNHTEKAQDSQKEVLDQDGEEEEEAREADLVVFENTSQGLGLKICGGFSVDGKQQDGIFVKRILPGGLAEIQGGLEEGDLILDVNGESMEGITYDRALSILRQASASNRVEMVITRDNEAREAFLELMDQHRLSQTSHNKAVSQHATLNLNGENGLSQDALEALHLHMEEFYKHTAILAVDHSLDFSPGQIQDHSDSMHSPYTADLLQPASDSHSSHESPASTCASELAGHLLYPGQVTEDHDEQNPDGKDINFKSIHSVLSGRLSTNPVKPTSRFPVHKLEMALLTLGFVVKPQEGIELRQHLHVDDHGLVSFEDFVDAVKLVFYDELMVRNGNLPTTPQLFSDVDRLSPVKQMNNYAEPKVADTHGNDSEILHNRLKP
ncbi:uncharacterized protein LOC112559161 isoform X1 [Pomacea canaliculata]|uniref:uncharacterized protein LOC112559161 isoform X1 n=1 Tax=Pomacea canaliculata TaxID=400727 RepID=UPI000D72FDA8|nr:uncharacterized protein LOC112559161 isoform X1 [Pomacea canaliculata]